MFNPKSGYFYFFGSRKQQANKVLNGCRTVIKCDFYFFIFFKHVRTQHLTSVDDFYMIAADSFFFFPFDWLIYSIMMRHHILAT